MRPGMGATGPEAILFVSFGLGSGRLLMRCPTAQCAAGAGKGRRLTVQLKKNNIDFVVRDGSRQDPARPRNLCFSMVWGGGRLRSAARASKARKKGLSPQKDNFIRDGRRQALKPMYL